MAVFCRDFLPKVILIARSVDLSGGRPLNSEPLGPSSSPGARSSWQFVFGNRLICFTNLYERILCVRCLIQEFKKVHSNYEQQKKQNKVDELFNEVFQNIDNQVKCVGASECGACCNLVMIKQGRLFVEFLTAAGHSPSTERTSRSAAGEEKAILFMASDCSAEVVCAGFLKENFML